MKVIILSGIPGSGKSTFLKGYESVVVCSADSFFMKDGEYKFDISKLSEAHSACLRKFILECTQGTSFIVVDNTNTTSEEIAPYYSIAKAYGYEVQLITMQCAPELGAARNIHGVPLKACQAMAQRIADRKLPPFWDIVEAKFNAVD